MRVLGLDGLDGHRRLLCDARVPGRNGGPASAATTREVSLTSRPRRCAGSHTLPAAAPPEAPDASWHARDVEIPVVWSVVLLVTAAWNLLIWPRFLQRIAKDPRSRDSDGRATRFLTVHVVLIAVSLVLALAVGVLGVLTLF
ncbi:Uncharacterised protein [Mycobacteroides abscessus]|nr:Uncharacterised protein [Mycobacteroides abscessus]